MRDLQIDGYPEFMQQKSVLRMLQGVRVPMTRAMIATQASTVVARFIHSVGSASSCPSDTSDYFHFEF